MVSVGAFSSPRMGIGKAELLKFGNTGCRSTAVTTAANDVNMIGPASSPNCKSLPIGVVGEQHANNRESTNNRPQIRRSKPMAQHRRFLIDGLLPQDKEADYCRKDRSESDPNVGQDRRIHNRVSALRLAWISSATKSERAEAKSSSNPRIFGYNPMWEALQNDSRGRSDYQGGR